MIAIPNFSPKDGLYQIDKKRIHKYKAKGGTVRVYDIIDIVTCGECKHRPIKDDSDGADYGFNIVEPTDRDDVCPYIVEDGWYSWMPEDNFFCAFGERRAD